MFSPRKAIGIDVAIHVTHTGCGNPCHPAHTCESCEAFWKEMQSTGRFDANVPPTFVGDESLHKRNLGSSKLDFAHRAFRRQFS